MKIEKCIVQFNARKEALQDIKILRKRLSPVNMRLYESSGRYRDIILDIIQYMKDILDTNFENYTQGKGISGANIGIPFNIIVVRRPITSRTGKVITFLSDKIKLKRTTQSYRYLVMINPRIIGKWGEKVTLKSNCGSLLLTKPVEIERYERISVHYSDINGKQKAKEFDLPISATIAHEIDHNNGILITDRVEGSVMYDIVKNR